MRISPNFDIEQCLSGFVAGIDEAGSGPWAGPVVAACVLFFSHDMQTLGKLTNKIFDSKQMSKCQREEVFQELTCGSLVEFAVGQASVLEIDTLGLSHATKLAMHRSFLGIQNPTSYILIDGIRKPDFSKDIHMIVKGDQKSLSIASASIIAKVTRDRIMKHLDHQYPQYGWGQNAGYGTKKHQEAIKIFGVTEYHRHSFAPIRAIVERNMN